MGIALPGPTLNISAWIIPGKFSNDTFRIQNEKDRLWEWSNETYTHDYISEKGTCQSTGVRISSFQKAEIITELSVRNINGDFPSCSFSL